MSEKIMLMGDVIESEDCDKCPLYGDYCNGGWKCYGGAPIEPPCCGWDDDILKMTTEEYLEYFEDGIMRAELAEERERKRESERIKSRKIREEQERFLEIIRSLNSSEVLRISGLIEKVEREISKIKSINKVNELFNMPPYAEIDEEKYNSTIKSLNEQLEAAEKERDLKVEEAKNSDRYKNIPKKYEGMYFSKYDN